MGCVEYTEHLYWIALLYILITIWLYPYNIINNKLVSRRFRLLLEAVYIHLR